MNINEKIAFINKFLGAKNAASGSEVDANANVTVKSVAVLESELFKKEFIKINRAMVTDTLIEMFGKQTADQFAADIKDHLIYIHDETSLRPYCVSISMYPFLLEGTKCLGGTSKAPKNLHSFCGSFINLVYQIASDFAGAVATVEFLMYFDYFARKEYGDNYLRTNAKEIEQELQGVLYAMNQPAAARGNQSVFWNISVFDENYFKALFDEFYFPDGTKPKWGTVEKLQNFFMSWFRKERTKELLTFPVVTAAYLVDEQTKLPKSEKFIEMLADEMSKGLSFFHYQSTSADSLASCCRLRNEMDENVFSYTLGAGGVSTGSYQVITINFNRLIQRGKDGVVDVVNRVHKYLLAYRKIVENYIDAGMLPTYTAGFISLDKQFGTIGINGALEAYEYLDRYENESYIEFSRYLMEWLSTIKTMNKEARKTYGVRFNTEFVPAENLGVKNAKWDKEAGLYVPRDCYNSYFYPVESEKLTILDRLEAHNGDISSYLDGGAACHLNLEVLPTKEQALSLIKVATRKGVPYWTTNVLCTICKHCGYIDPVTRAKCKECGSDDLDYGTRVIGYLKPISSFSAERQREAWDRDYMSGLRTLNYITRKEELN